MSKLFAIVGRVLLSLIFIISGLNKLVDVAGTSQLLANAGLPGELAIATGLFELVAGLCLALGFMVRLIAILLSGFTALTILYFHNQFSDPLQGAMALKNVAVIGGLLLAFAHSQMWSHYYTIRTERRGELATRDMERRLHETELRAARAEARADAAQDGEIVVADTDHDGIPDVQRRRRWLDW